MIERANQLDRLSDHAQRVRLFETATRLLPKTDPQHVESLVGAGMASYYSGRKEYARDLFKRAGAIAQQQGNLIAAADAYYFGLIISFERSEPEVARQFADRTLVIAASPALSDNERGVIMRRIAQPVSKLMR